MTEHPIDMYSIHDIEEWRRTFCYPVSKRFDRNISFSLTDKFADLYQNLNDKDLKLYFRIASKQLYLDSFDLIYKLFLAYRMGKFRNVRFYLDHFRRPKTMKMTDRSNVFEIYNNNSFITLKNIRRSLNLKREGPIHRSTVNMYYHCRRYRECSLDNAKHLIINPSGVTNKYVSARCDGGVYLLRKEDIFIKKRNNICGTSLPRNITNLAYKCGDVINDLYKETTGFRLNGYLVEQFIEGVNNHFRTIIFDLHQGRRFIKKVTFGARLYTGTAKYQTRIVSEVLRERGNLVTGLPHGGGLSNIIYPETTFVEFATCDRFICLDELESSQFAKYLSINDISFPVVPGLSRSWYHIDGRREKLPARIDLNQVNTIMYVTIGDHYDEYRYDILPNLVHLDMQMNIIDYLLSLEKKLIFKNRPKTVYSNMNHFGYYSGKVEYCDKPFTDVLNEADLFVFEGRGSSALYEACTLTETPIVLFDRNYPEFTPEFLNVLKKRCYLIPMYEDDKNRLRFDERFCDDIFA